MVLFLEELNDLALLVGFNADDVFAVSSKLDPACKILVYFPWKRDFMYCIHFLLDNQILLKDAKLELKKSKRKDYYKILGVTKTASDDEIKKAYRKRALAHHPG